MRPHAKLVHTRIGNQGSAMLTECLNDRGLKRRAVVLEGPGGGGGGWLGGLGYDVGFDGDGFPSQTPVLVSRCWGVIW